MFELLCEIHFTINIPSVEKNEAFFSFWDAVLGISNIFFDNSIQCVNKIWI